MTSAVADDANARISRAIQGICECLIISALIVQRGKMRDASENSAAIPIGALTAGASVGLRRTPAAIIVSHGDRIMVTSDSACRKKKIAENPKPGPAP
jgi:hypothetical protein